MIEIIFVLCSLNLVLFSSVCEAKPTKHTFWPLKSCMSVIYQCGDGRFITSNRDWTLCHSFLRILYACGKKLDSIHIVYLIIYMFPCQYAHIITTGAFATTQDERSHVCVSASSPSTDFVNKNLIYQLSHTFETSSRNRCHGHHNSQTTNMPLLRMMCNWM